MEEQQMIEVYKPTGTLAMESIRLSTRLDTLDGKVLGIVNNGKWNSKDLLVEIESILTKIFNVSEVLWWKKESYSSPSPQDLREEIAKKCDAVLTAIGD